MFAVTWIFLSTPINSYGGRGAVRIDFKLKLKELFFFNIFILYFVFN